MSLSRYFSSLSNNFSESTTYSYLDTFSNHHIEYKSQNNYFTWSLEMQGPESSKAFKLCFLLSLWSLYLISFKNSTYVSSQESKCKHTPPMNNGFDLSLESSLVVFCCLQKIEKIGRINIYLASTTNWTTGSNCTTCCNNTTQVNQHIEHMVPIGQNSGIATWQLLKSRKVWLFLNDSKSVC